MSTELSNESIYSDLRVLDLAGEMGAYCGKLLADLGAEVIKVERPGGDATRRIGPFVGDDPHPEKSLYWFQFNTSKKSVTLDIATADGKDIFRKLAATSDIIIETFSPGYMDSLGLGYEELSKDNPGLIMTSITPFGQTGPYRDYKASDIVGLAMGGQLYLAGMPGEPPLQAGASQAYYQANLHAAVGTLIAVHFRDGSGLGQYIDLSMQEAITLSMETAMQYWDMNRHLRKRTGHDHRSPGHGVYPCQDGFVCLMASAGAGKGWAPMVSWMNEEGQGQELAGSEWLDRYYRIDHLDEGDAYIMPWLLDHTVQDAVDGLQARHCIAMPVNTPKDLLESPQLRSRDFYVQVAHPELSAEYEYPGAPYRFNHIEWRISHRAPLIGEHNQEIFEGLGLTGQDLIALRGAGVI
ncbi:MAG: CoA transferase [Dehalococcoidia bacterium]|nr:CoA transferase [Dehalococcoidia bacterium]